MQVGGQTDKAYQPAKVQQLTIQSPERAVLNVSTYPSVGLMHTNELTGCDNSEGCCIHWQ